MPDLRLDDVERIMGERHPGVVGSMMLTIWLVMAVQTAEVRGLLRGRPLSAEEIADLLEDLMMRAGLLEAIPFPRSAAGLRGEPW